MSSSGRLSIHLTCSALQLTVINLLWPRLTSITPILISRDNSSLRQSNRPPNVMRVTVTLMPAVYTFAVSVQVLGFEDVCLLTHCERLIYDFCSSGQCFAFDFLQISPRDEHPCRSANYSPCRANSGLSPPSHLTATTRIRTAPIMGATRHAWRTKKIMAL